MVPLVPQEETPSAGSLIHNEHMYTTLISPQELQSLRQSGTPVFVADCSFNLIDPLAGRQQFDAIHIAGAQHVDIDHIMSEKGHGPRDSGGRHPLPSREVFARRMADLGLRTGAQVVVYDRQGANYCGRLWWMLKWCGHEAVAVLDGGLQAWQAAELPVATSAAAPAQTVAPGDFAVQRPLAGTVSAAEMLKMLAQPDVAIVDARASARFRGETEPLDPVAGHMPGAINRPFGDNLDANGYFKSPEQLRAEFSALLGQRDPTQTIHHCGSGVSAIPNVLGMAIAGWGITRLFPGSWSEWCATPDAIYAQG